MTEEHKRKISEAQKGKPRFYNRGEFNPAKRKEVRIKLSLASKGKKKSLEHRASLSLAKKGKKPSNETRLKMSYSHKKRVSDGLNHLWRGGIDKLHKSERKLLENSIEYRLWRKSVFERDNYTYRFCGKRGGNIHADHIKPFAIFPELRLAIDNGRTLCINCHRQTETYGRKLFNITKPT